MSVYRNADAGSYAEDVDDAYNTPLQLVPPAAEAVLIEVAARNGNTDDIGTFAIRVQQVDVTVGTVGAAFASDTIATNEEIWFRFDVANGTTYSVEWDDVNDGSGSFTADITVSAYRPDSDNEGLNDYFLSQTSGYAGNAETVAASTDVMFIKVEEATPPGTFGLRVQEQ